MILDEFDALFNRYLANQLSADETRQLTDALKDSRFKQRWCELSDLEGALSDEIKLSPVNSAEHESKPASQEGGGVVATPWHHRIGHFAWRKRFVAVAVAAAILVALLISFADTGSAHSAVLAAFSPGVELSRKNVTLVPNLRLLDGDTILVSSGATATLAYRDGTRVDIEPDTNLTFQPIGIHEDKSTKHIYIARGGLTAQIAPQPSGQPMFFTTPHAIAEVLGTQIKLTAGADQTNVRVTEGRVQVYRTHDNKSAFVEAGHYVVASAGDTAPMLQQSVLPRVLLVTLEAANYTHKVLHAQHGAAYSLVEEQLMAAAANRFQLVTTHSFSALTPEGLKPYRAVVFFTGGVVPLTEKHMEALSDFVNAGGGFVGIHSVAVSFMRGKFFALQEMLGGRLETYNDSRVRLNVAEPNHPATKDLPASFELTDRILYCHDLASQHVTSLLTLDKQPNEYANKEKREFSLAWSRQYGKGRVFFTSLGHTEQVWRDEKFIKHVSGGIEWAIGDERD